MTEMKLKLNATDSSHVDTQTCIYIYTNIYTYIYGNIYILTHMHIGVRKFVGVLYAGFVQVFVFVCVCFINTSATHMWQREQLTVAHL